MRTTTPPSCVVDTLRLEYLVEPQGIDECEPRFSWLFHSERRGARQIAYRIRVASSQELLGAGSADMWDSGRVESSRTAQIPYAGQLLKSRQRCFWQVDVWAEVGASPVSASSSWTMGLLDPGDWKGQWLSAPPGVIERDAEATAPSLKDCGTPILFRKEFLLGAKPRRATLYVTARGVIDLELNGRPVSEDRLAPEWTDYNRRIHYRTYDVTHLLEGSRAAIGAILADGWWSGYVGWQERRGRYGSLQNSILMQLEVEYLGGETETFPTDPSWRCETGPTLSSDFMMGESYDARREHEGWSRVGFDDGAWLPAQRVDAPAAELCAQPGEPVRVVETLAPISRREIEDGSAIFDIGQNISGWARLTVKQPTGTRLQLRFAERLKPDGMLYTDNLRRAASTDVYICKGQGVEVWEPRFTFHGFQFIELSGLVAGELDPVSARVVHSALAFAGHFECSNADVNRLWLNGLWSQRDNFLSVPTDCPQRDERLGWMGDAQIFLRTATYNMDIAAFFTKWMVDVSDAQTPEGVFPDTAPRLPEGENYVGLDKLAGGAAWADAGIIIPHTLWRVYGDLRVVERHWDAMTSWMEYLERTNPEYLRLNELGNNYGDWLCIPSDREFRTHSPMKNLLATAYWADGAVKMAEMARALGKVDSAEHYETLFDKVRAAFQRQYVKADGSLSVETQTAYLLALAMKLMPNDLRKVAAQHLASNIEALGWHLSTGFVGIRFLNPVLTEMGHSDVAYRLLLQDDYPSWLYPVKHGATTIWERWNGWTEEDGFFDPLMNSFNHYSLGSVGEWLFSHVAGIELDATAAGFEKAQLKPYVDERLSHVTASYLSLHGEYRSSWRCEEAAWLWSFRIPANTSARVWIPRRGATLLVDNKPISACEGIELAEERRDWWVCQVVAGSYEVCVL